MLQEHLILVFNPLMVFYEERERLIQFRTFESIVQFQYEIIMINSQNKDEPIEDDDE